MRHVAPIRKELAIPTTFNFLGPLANPAQPIATALGVADQKIAPLMALELSQRGRTALVFRSEDGLDELSTTAEARIWQVSNGSVTEQVLDARELGLTRVSQKELLGGDAKHNAEVAAKLFAGQDFENASAIREVVLLNAAAGIVAFELAKNAEIANESIESRFTKALASAEQALTSGEAARKLSNWSQATQSA